MKEIKLTIKGNQINRKGNPIPYLRTTQNSQWSDKAKRYQDWKRYVVASLIDFIQSIPKEQRQKYAEVINLANKKPIVALEKKAYMTLAITFMDKTHADCDNIFKGIADALFTNDKYLASKGFDYKYGDEGKVEVIISFI